MPLIDAHLDLAYNAWHHKTNLHIPALQRPANVEGLPTVSIPDLRAAGAMLICSTIFCLPEGSTIDGHPTAGYRNAAEARAQAIPQLQWYQDEIKAGTFRFVRTAADLPSASPADSEPIPTILLMEGADPITDLNDLPFWHDAGVRMVGMAWKRTRYCGGTDAPGPLTADGIALAKALDRLGIIHDATHLSEESFWRLLDVTTGPVAASHSNCRGIVGADPICRHLTDDMVKAIAARGGVIGAVMYEKFFLPSTIFKTRRGTMNDVIDHIDRICQLTGSANHVGIGSDMDGGFDRNQIPVEMQTSADLPKFAEPLARRGYSQADIDAILYGNWLNFFRTNLPS